MHVLFLIYKTHKKHDESLFTVSGTPEMDMHVKLHVLCSGPLQELFGVQKGLCFLLPVRRSYSYVAVSVAWQDVERLHVLQNVFLSCF